MGDQQGLISALQEQEEEIEILRKEKTSLEEQLIVCRSNRNVELINLRRDIERQAQAWSEKFESQQRDFERERLSLLIGLKAETDGWTKKIQELEDITQKKIEEVKRKFKVKKAQLLEEKNILIADIARVGEEQKEERSSLLKRAERVQQKEEEVESKYQQLDNWINDKDKREDDDDDDDDDEYGECNKEGEEDDDEGEDTYEGQECSQEEVVRMRDQFWGTPKQAEDWLCQLFTAAMRVYQADSPQATQGRIVLSLFALLPARPIAVLLGASTSTICQWKRYHSKGNKPGTIPGLGAPLIVKQRKLSSVHYPRKNRKIMLIYNFQRGFSPKGIRKS